MGGRSAWRQLGSTVTSASSSLLRAMWRIRAFEERVGQLTRADEVHGLVHLSVGQEGVAVGVCGQLRPDDAVYSNHRAHGHAIAKGAPLGRVMAELMGRDGRALPGPWRLDASRGRRARLPRRDRCRRRQRPARARERAREPPLRRRPGGRRLLRRRRRPGRHLRRVGEPRDALGAAGDPRLREQRLRRVHAALGAHERRARCGRRGALRARSRDRRRQRRRRRPCRVLRVPGRARRGEGPFLLECLTHRLRGHYEGDPQHYREALAADEWQELDPILRLQRRGVEEGWLAEDEPARLEEEAQQEVEQAVEAARQSPFPPISLTAELVYAT